MAQIILKQQQVYGLIQEMKQIILIIILQTLIVAKLKFYKAKLLENIVSQPTPNAENGILRNATWRSPEIPLINCKVELEFKWAKYCVLYAAGNETNFNEDAYADNVIFTMKNTQLYNYMFL